MTVSDETPEDQPEDHIRSGKISAESVNASELIKQAREKYPDGGPMAKDPTGYPTSQNRSDTADRTTQDRDSADQAVEPPDEGGASSAE